MSKTIVIISASSGGGHNAAGNAIIHRVRAQYGDEYQYKMIDVYENNMASRLPWLAKIRYQSDFVWRLFLLATNNRWSVRIIALLMRPYIMSRLSRELPENTSHIIAVHFCPAQVLGSLASKFTIKPKTSIVVTDFDPHWAWLGPDSDQLFVVSDSGIERARSIGYQKNALTKMQIVPVSDIHYKSAPRDSKAPLRFMLVSGQDGSNTRQIVEIIKLLNQQCKYSQIELTVVCGKNEKLKKSLENRQKEFKSISLSIKGYVENVAHSFHRYDLMLVRTSPGVLSECITAGVPILGFDWTAHEVFQARFIQQNELGLASRNSNLHAKFLNKIVNDTDYLNQLQKNAQRFRQNIDYSTFVQRLVLGDV